MVVCLVVCCVGVGEEGGGLRTRWLVMMALPSLHLTEKGSAPG